jgi:hypothetical protein
VGGGAGARALDLDDVGAHVGEDAAGDGAGDGGGELEDADAGKWALSASRRR